MPVKIRDARVPPVRPTKTKDNTKSANLTELSSNPPSLLLYTYLSRVHAARRLGVHAACPADEVVESVRHLAGAARGAANYPLDEVLGAFPNVPGSRLTGTSCHETNE